MPNPGPLGRVRTLLGHGIIGLYPEFTLSSDTEAKAFSQLLKAWNDADHLDDQTFHHLFVGDKLASPATTRLLREAARKAAKVETIDQMIAASHPLTQAIKAIGPDRWPHVLQNLEGQAEAVADSHNVPWGSQAGDAASKGWFDLQLDKAKKALGMPGGVLDVIADEVNPTNSGDNCGHIIDAVIARLRGTDPKAVAQAGLDGSWADILKRYNTKILLGISFDEAFKRVREGGNGTIAIIGIVFKNGLSHVVVITIDNGAVGIVEGQSTKKHPKKVIYTAEEAYERYNRICGGIASIGYAAIPP